jgi:hypothetical protein
MIQCETCGYSRDHLRHYQNCGIPKADWPEHYKVKGAPVSRGSVAVTGNPLAQALEQMETARAKPEKLNAEARERISAQVEAPTVTEGRPVASPASVAFPSGACCEHPEQVHIADAEGFPPTCMGCPDSDDAHEWRPQEAVSGEASSPAFPDLADVDDAGSASSPEAAPFGLYVGDPDRVTAVTIPGVTADTYKAHAQACDCGYTVPATSKNASAAMRMHRMKSKQHRG